MSSFCNFKQRANANNTRRLAIKFYFDLMKPCPDFMKRNNGWLRIECHAVIIRDDKHALVGTELSLSFGWFEAKQFCRFFLCSFSWTRPVQLADALSMVASPSLTATTRHVFCSTRKPVHPRRNVLDHPFFSQALTDLFLKPLVQVPHLKAAFAVLAENPQRL